MSGLNDKGSFSSNYHDYKKTVLTYAAFVAVAAAATLYPAKGGDLSAYGFKLSAKAMVLVVTGLCVATVYYVAQFTLRWRDEAIVALPNNVSDLQTRIDEAHDNQRLSARAIQDMSKIAADLRGLERLGVVYGPIIPPTAYYERFIREELSAVQESHTIAMQMGQVYSESDRWNFGEMGPPPEERARREAERAAKVEEYFDNFIPSAIEKAAEKCVQLFLVDLNDRQVEVLGMEQELREKAQSNLNQIEAKWSQLSPSLDKVVAQAEKWLKTVYEIRKIRHREVLADIVVVYIVAISSLLFWGFSSKYFEWAANNLLVGFGGPFCIIMPFAMAAWWWGERGGGKAR